MRIATTIFTFGGGREITKRHLPIWRAHTDDLLLVFPYDDPCVLPDVDMLAHEVSNKYGMPCLRRQLSGMKAALRYNADYYVFIEYDGFMLRLPLHRDAVQANLFHHKRQNIGHATCFCPHFPWVFPRDILERFVAEANFEPFERGFVDRWLAAQMERMGIPFHGFQDSGEGYSRNTIQYAEEKEAVLRCVDSGGYAIHGVKTPELLQSILAKAGRLDLFLDIPDQKKKPEKRIHRILRALKK
jgi:hypothetical protein